MTITVIYAGAEDSEISSGAPWFQPYADAREGTGTATLAVSPTGTLLTSGQYEIFGYGCIQSVLQFAAENLPDGASILGAVLVMILEGEFLGGVTPIEEVRLKDWGTAAETADWTPGSGLAALTLVATLTTAGKVWVQGAAYPFDDAGLKAAISTTAPLRLLIDDSRHRNGNVPAGAQTLRFYSADNAGSVLDPKLVIVHDTYHPFGPTRPRIGPTVRRRKRGRV